MTHSRRSRGLTDEECWKIRNEYHQKTDEELASEMGRLRSTVEKARGAMRLRRPNGGGNQAAPACRPRGYSLDQIANAKASLEDNPADQESWYILGPLGLLPGAKADGAYRWKMDHQ